MKRLISYRSTLHHKSPWKFVYSLKILRFRGTFSESDFVLQCAMKMMVKIFMTFLGSFDTVPLIEALQKHSRTFAEHGWMIPRDKLHLNDSVGKNFWTVRTTQKFSWNFGVSACLEILQLKFRFWRRVWWWDIEGLDGNVTHPRPHNEAWSGRIGPNRCECLQLGINWPNPSQERLQLVFLRTRTSFI